MAGVEQHSEFEGGGVMPNTVFPKGAKALTNDDKLRLQSTTGQEIDSQASVDPFFWHGNEGPDPEQAKRTRQAWEQDQRLIKQQARDRYRESRN